MNFNSYNPGLLTRNASAIRNHMAAVCGNFNAEWSCYYFGHGFASIRDENGKCWDICLTTNSIIPA